MRSWNLSSISKRIQCKHQKFKTYRRWNQKQDRIIKLTKSNCNLYQITEAEVVIEEHLAVVASLDAEGQRLEQHHQEAAASLDVEVAVRAYQVVEEQVALSS